VFYVKRSSTTYTFLVVKFIWT